MKHSSPRLVFSEPDALKRLQAESRQCLHPILDALLPPFWTEPLNENYEPTIGYTGHLPD